MGVDWNAGSEAYEGNILQFQKDLDHVQDSCQGVPKGSVRSLAHLDEDLAEDGGPSVSPD